MKTFDCGKESQAKHQQQQQQQNIKDEGKERDPDHKQRTERREKA